MNLEKSRNGMNLDSYQKKAIEVNKGPCMVLAGPGSGKTTVITHRIKHLIEYYDVDPKTILVITFTRAAAMEMKTRFCKLTNLSQSGVNFGTFHSVYFHILKRAYGYTADNIVREEQRIQFIKELVRRLRMEYEDENELVGNLLAEISMVKNSCISLEHYYSSSCGEDVFRHIYNGYQEFLYQNHYLDFDDMLVYCKELLEQRPDILTQWQKRFSYILIDEFQDINQIQFDIIRMLAAPQNNLFIVGDDDQSIYRFRGAKPEIMLNFERVYPKAKKIVLGVNYRSGYGIVKASKALIGCNQVRYKKNLRSNAVEGKEPFYLDFETQRLQNTFVVDEIQKLHRTADIPYHDMAVLFRTNQQPRLMMQQMMDVNVPYIAKDTIPNLYEHWIAVDLMTYVKVALGDRSRASILKIMNKPKRYLSREGLPYDTVAFDVWEDFYKGKQWMIQRLEKFEIDLNLISRMRPYSALNYIRKAVDYEGYLKEIAAERKIAEDDLLDILDEIHENAKTCSDFDSWFQHIEDTKEQWKENKQQERTNEDAVSFCTLHSAKGLEYEVVFIVDVNEKIMPYKKALLDQDVEEERRLFYVGMTRAKRRLYICSSCQINNKEMQKSRFIEESKVRLHESS